MIRHKGFCFCLSLMTLLVSCNLAASATSNTWVSRFGNDANDCSLPTPCRTIANALGKTPSAGQVVVLDSGEYGPFTISQSVSIVANGVTASVVATGDIVPAITIAAGQDDVVSLRGLTVQTTFKLNGIAVQSGNTLIIDECSVQGFTAGGIEISGPTNVYIRNSIISHNSIGVFLGSSGSQVTAIDHSSLVVNTHADVQFNTSNNTVILSNSSLLSQNSIVELNPSSNSQILSLHNNVVVNTNNNNITKIPLQ